MVFNSVLYSTYKRFCKLQSKTLRCKGLKGRYRERLPDATMVVSRVKMNVELYRIGAYTTRLQGYTYFTGYDT